MCVCVCVCLPQISKINSLKTNLLMFLLVQVLADGYLMIGIDGSEAVDGSDWFCYHGSSPSIFPVGFCEINSIELTPPRGN